ncbi:hypothetical protein L9F63_024541 [Diploptera punctata]|uniref:Fibronectin type-III domain-containing protein n=1 Tax=Diploptera punctata TaxID=6984 RepID=A0AAD7ZF42_DIPPU|nr:hypothetical protein L9F63_024541 [Diploptera punctata]
MHYKCPNITQNETDGMCYWDIKTDPHYRQPYEYYYFTITGKNSLGNWSKQIKFHHYSHVLPDPPTDLTISNMTINSAVLKWKVPFPMQLFPPGMLHKIEYQSQWDSMDTWMVANTSSLIQSQENYTYILNGLKYANSLYDVRIYMRSKLAVGEDKWSQPTKNTFKTMPKIPGATPKVDVGSFEVSGGLPNRDVYIYWQRIPEYLKNGDKFQYKVISVLENGQPKILIPDETTNAYIKFRGISFNSFKFRIASVNEIGQSREVSDVYVPSKPESPREPESFTKIAFEGGKYELSWKPPVNSDRMKIDNYTLFWCDHDRDRPYQCTGFLNWTHVPSTATVKMIEVPDNKIYQFAISANTKNGSSGMVWASCTVIHNKVVGKMKSVWINSIAATSIEVGWKLDCSDRIGTVQGFNIYYCPIISPYNLSCKAKEQNTTVKGDFQTIRGRVTDLKPYTTYMVAVAVITQSGEGLQSEPLYNTTLEAAPSQPDPVTITNITNTSMVVSWKPPTSMNGAVRRYDIYYNNKVKKFDILLNVKHQDFSPLKLTLTNLTSYYNYTVSVAACTVECSLKSIPVTVQTDIGVPGEMERPTVQGINSSMVLVTWSPPQIPAGLLNYYEVAVIKVDSHNTKNHSITTNVTAIALGNSSMVSVPNCKTEGYLKYLFQVRAVNLGTNNVTYYGNWSSPGESNCYASGLPEEIIVVIWVCGVIVVLALILLFCYISKRAWHRCKEMQVVEVKLPPGLEGFVLQEKEKEEHEYWPTDNRDHLAGKPRSNTSADEELLLQKKEERHGRNPSGDSSGCSSGHESVSSSLTSGTQCSSDSGTEVDQHPPSPDGVFADSPTWESSSLRQRNVSSSRPDGTDASRWDPYVKMGKNGGNGGTGSVARSTPNLTELEGMGVGTGGYTCLGTWSSTGYISMPSSEEMGSTGGVLATTGGYCRVGLDGQPTDGQNSQQPVAQPNKGYVSLASMIDTSSAQSTANSSTHSSPRQASQSPPRGYVLHHPLWPNPKEATAGKGYVMAGEMANKVPGASGSLMEEEEVQRREQNCEDEELHSPESYCRFALRPGVSSSATKEPEQERNISGYVMLPESKAASGTSAGTSGYVPHRQFDKRDAYQDHSDQSYTKVYPSSTSV